MRAKILVALAVLGLAACNSSSGGGDVPIAPTALQATPGNQQVSIAWTNSAGATSYNLYWSTTAGVTPTTGTKISSATKPYVHTGLTNGTQYYYVATAVNAVGESAASSQASAIPATNPAPAAPTGVLATAGNQQVTVSWTNVPGATSYNVYWSTTAGVTPATGTVIPGAANPLLHTGRANGTPYYYVVTAVNGNGESTASAQVSATPSAAPFISAFVLSTPGGVVPPFGFLEQVQVCTDATCSTSVSNATVTLNGTALTYDAARQQYTGVQVIAAGAAVTLQVTVGGTVYGATGTQFATAPTVTAPAAGATWQGASANTISWTGVGSPPSGSSYVVGVMDATGNFLYPVSGGGRGGPKEVSTGTTSETVPASTLSAGSFDVMLGIATSGIAGGGSGGIPIASTATGSGLWLGLIAPLVPVTVQSASAPAAPTGVQATPGNQQVTVQWANVSGATSYNLYWSTTSGVTPATGTQVAGATSPYLHTARTNGTPYYYVVTAVNAIGESAPSAQVTATPSATPPPAAPTGVQATAGNQQVTVSWTSVSGATSYNLYWSTTSGVTPATGTRIAGVSNPYTHSGRTNGTPYYYVVTALNGNGESAASAQVTATPSAAPYISVFVLSAQGGGVPPFGFLQQAQVCTDSSCNTPVANATVTVNGGAPLTYDAGRSQYTGTQAIAAGAAVTVQVVVGGVTYGVSGTQFASAPTLSAPAAGATWQGASANVISWSGGAPTTGASYFVGVMDAAGNFIYPVPGPGGGGPKEISIGTTSDTVPAGTLAAGSDDVMVGIGTTGLASGNTGGIPIPNTAPGSGLWLGFIGPLAPITVQAASPPSAPTGIQATPGNSQVTVSWSSVSAATSYNLYWSTTSGVTPTNGTKITGVSRPYVHSGRTNGTPYYYVVTAVNGNGESAASAQVTATPVAAPYVSALVITQQGGGVPGFGFTEQVRVCTDSTCNTAITDATVTVNGGAALTYNAGNRDYTGVEQIAPGATVALQVTVAGIQYGVSATQFTSAPTVSAPTSGATWASGAANTISWSGGAPTSGAVVYAVGVVNNGTGNWVYPVPSGEGGGPKEVAIGTTSDTVPAGTLSTGSYSVLVGLGTAGIGGQASGGISIPGTATGSGLWLGMINPLIPVTVP